MLQVSLEPSPGKNARCGVHVLPPKKLPPTNESRRREGTDVEPFAEASVLILLATETIGERFCCCQEKKSCCEGRLSEATSRLADLGESGRLEYRSVPAHTPVFKKPSVKRYLGSQFIRNLLLGPQLTGAFLFF